MMLSVRISRRLSERLDELAARRRLNRSQCLRAIVAEASMTAAERAELPDVDELLVLLSERARSGNVAAIRALIARAESAAAGGDGDEGVEWVEFPDDDPFVALEHFESRIPAFRRRSREHHDQEGL